MPQAAIGSQAHGLKRINAHMYHCHLKAEDSQRVAACISENPGTAIAFQCFADYEHEQCSRYATDQGITYVMTVNPARQVYVSVKITCCDKQDYQNQYGEFPL